MLNPLEFEKLCDEVILLVNKHSGNRFGENERSMVHSRLTNRIANLKMNSALEYSDYLKKNIISETKELVSLLTTHYTFFFREFSSFEYIKKILPAMIEKAKQQRRNTIKVWCAACSTGQEVYSLAMFLNVHLKEIDSMMDFSIVGSDIDEKAVNFAKNGVYHVKEIREVPILYVRDQWQKGPGEISEYVKLRSSVASKCRFMKGNLLNSHLISDKEGPFDLILCRNVLIYFDKDQIKLISQSLLNALYPHGLLITGISESISSINSALNQVAPSIYGRHYVKVELGLDIQASKELTKESVKQKKKVLCVDDSPTIIKLLKKALEESGDFEVSGTAQNGLEAIEYLKNNKVDVITLDIHMPEMDGITYLKTNYSHNHPPVLIVSSASRDDSSIVMDAFKFGASDYVEKPDMSNFLDRKDEIVTKLKVLTNDSVTKNGISEIDLSFKKEFTLTDPDKKIRVIFLSLGQIHQLKNLINSFYENQPPLLLVTEGQAELLEANAEKWKYDLRLPLSVLRGESDLVEINKCYLVDFTLFKKIIESNKNRAQSFMVTGNPTHKLLDYLKIISSDKVQILVEDIVSNHQLKMTNSEVVPVTSFTYHSDRFFYQKK